MKKIILASASPARSKLLEDAGFQVLVKPADLDESVLADESPEAHVQRLAYAKADKINVSGDAIIVAADTVVVLENEIIGKARDAEHAREIIQKLSGQTHRVLTGLCVRIIEHDDEELILELAETKVTFREINSAELDDYLQSEEWCLRAGAYGIQNNAHDFVVGVEGSVSNVVGLPMEILATILGIGLRTEARS